MTWMLAAAFVVMILQLGFALVNAGFTRAQNVAHTISASFLLYAIGLLGYWACGFAFQLNDIAELGFRGAHLEPAIPALFLFQAMLMATALVIPTGALAERWRFPSMALYGVAMSTLIYP